MAVQEVPIAALSEIPALAADFATSVGWLVSGTPTEPVIQHPTLVGAIPFTLSYELTGTSTSTRQRLQWKGPVGTTYYAATLAPMRGTNSVPDFVAPTKVIFIGGLLPEPYLAIVIEFGYNLYRHLYLGNMEKLGDYAGGEVIAGSAFGVNKASGSFWWDEYGYTQFLFGSYQVVWSAASAGGVRVEHADNPDTWRTFLSTTSGTPQSATTFAQTGVLGGYRDNINDIYVARGKNTYAGAAMLVPVNLYAVRPANNLSPIGRPAGIRLINMTDIDPASSIEVGAKTWRCFPAFKKSEATVITRPVSSWPTDESSLFVGYAYLED